MSATIKLNYDQIRDNALQLPSQERIRLVKELNQHEQSQETKTPEPNDSGFTELWRENGMVCYRVNGDPIFTPEEISEFEENRKRLEAEIAKIPREEIEQEKEEAIRAALALPTCSDEEWAEIQEMRKILRPCQPFF
ncbi:MAG: hypothetical protein LBQ50_08615 [Planctomycetaceae bacterium]|jgi:hypothetical protein|nr:hypothetical protein [Planctomycetaceae bacterium]